MASLEKQIQDLTARVEKLEAALAPNAKSKAKVKGNAAVTTGNYKGATGGVRHAIDSGYFDKEKRELGQISKALGDNGYHYSKQAIHEALKRLSDGSGTPLVVLKEGKVNKYVRRK